MSMNEDPIWYHKGCRSVSQSDFSSVKMEIKHLQDMIA